VSLTVSGALFDRLLVPCCAGFQVSGLLRERTKLQILQEAVIVASTLSFAGETGFAGPLGDGQGC
jgi:hypothetical protein